jgi:hypothetical protein
LLLLPDCSLVRPYDDVVKVARNLNRPAVVPFLHDVERALKRLLLEVADDDRSLLEIEEFFLDYLNDFRTVDLDYEIRFLCRFLNVALQQFIDARDRFPIRLELGFDEEVSRSLKRIPLQFSKLHFTVSLSLS